MIMVQDKTISCDDFYNNKNAINQELYVSFQKKFKRLIYQYKSLSTSLTNYKKIQKVNIISTPNSYTTILNLLNKITYETVDRILQKILLKTNADNAITFVKQILGYTEKSGGDNCTIMWYLIQKIFEHSTTFNTIDNIDVEIIKTLEDFVQSFIYYFDVSQNPNDTTCNKEQYLEFIQRNIDNNAIIAKAKLTYVILSDTINMLSPKFTVKHVIENMIQRLRVNIKNHNTSLENVLHMNLECLRIFFDYVKSESDYISVKQDFIKDFDTKEIKQIMSNKNKFKLMDIIDLIKIDNNNK